MNNNQNPPKFNLKTINNLQRKKAFFFQYVGLLFYFVTFNIVNLMLFYFIWNQPVILFKILYFALLGLFIKFFYLPTGFWFLRKYISESEIIQLLKARQQFWIFTVLYGMAYFGSLKTEGKFFVSYMSVCFVTHIIMLLIFQHKYKKAFKNSEFYEEQK